MNRISAGLLAFIISSFLMFLGCEKKATNIETPKNQSDANNQAKISTRGSVTIAAQSGKKFGPFDIGQKRIAITYDYGTATTGDLLEIKDESGVSYHKETFHNDEESSLTVQDVFKVEGRSGEGLMVIYDLAPNAPPCGPEFQLYGMKNSSLQALSPRIIVCGHIENPPTGSQNGAFRLLDGDLINVEVWKDFFGIKIPFKIDFQKMTIAPFTAQTVFDVNIPYSVDTIDTSEGNEITFYSDLHDVSKAESINASDVRKVEFIGANAEIQLENVSTFQLDIKVTNVCLRVRINGREGWVIDVNDFHILGLRPIG